VEVLLFYMVHCFTTTITIYVKIFTYVMYTFFYFFFIIVLLVIVL